MEQRRERFHKNRISHVHAPISEAAHVSHFVQEPPWVNVHRSPKVLLERFVSRTWGLAYKLTGECSKHGSSRMQLLISLAGAGNEELVHILCQSAVKYMLGNTLRSGS